MIKCVVCYDGGNYDPGQVKSAIMIRVLLSRRHKGVNEYKTKFIKISLEHLYVLALITRKMLTLGR